MNTDSDAGFLELFLSSAELTPANKKYDAYVSFNKGAVERGRSVVQRLQGNVSLTDCDALDVGTGSGGLAIALAECGCRVTAIEPDPLRARWAKARFEGHDVKIDLIETCAENLPFADESFDLVTLDSVIEHVERPRAVIGEVARVLRPNGIAYLVVPNKLSIFNILSDPHYGMFGVVLLPHWAGRLYIERVRHASRGYWVNVTPTKRWLTKRFAENRMRVGQIAPEGFHKLTMPGVPISRSTAVRMAVRIANHMHLSRQVQRLALTQFPSLILLANKEQNEMASKPA